MSVSVAELFPEVGSVVPAGTLTVAVLLNVPDASLAMVAFKVKVAVPPLSRLTVVLMLPEPVAAPQLDPGGAVQVQVALVSLTGNVSTTVALVTALGPLLVATIV